MLLKPSSRILIRRPTGSHNGTRSRDSPGEERATGLRGFVVNGFECVRSWLCAMILLPTEWRSSFVLGGRP